MRAEILRGLFHRAVDVAQRGREIDQDEREVVDRLDEDDAVQPVHEGDLEAEPVVEQQVDGAVAAEEQLHRHRADEGRHDQRQKAQRLDQHRAAKRKARGDVGERQREDRGARRPPWPRRRANSRTSARTDRCERNRAKLTSVKAPPPFSVKATQITVADRPDQEHRKKSRDAERQRDLAGRRRRRRARYGRWQGRCSCRDCLAGCSAMPFTSQASALPRPWLAPAA